MAGMVYGGAMDPRQFSPQGYAGSVAGGGMRSGPRRGPSNQGGMMPTQGGAPMPAAGGSQQPFLPNGGMTLPTGVSPTANGYMQALSGQVKAYGDMAGQDFRKSAGQMLGNLNGIGALRSGAVQSGLNDLTTNYGRQIGNYAAMTAGQGLEMGQREEDLQTERNFRQKQYDDARKASRGRTIGKVIGAAGAIGSMLPIPGAAQVGTALGAISNVF